MASASETPSAFLVDFLRLRFDCLPAFLELLRPLPRSPLSGLRPPFPLLSQWVVRFRAIFHFRATERVFFHPKIEVGFRTRCTPCLPSCVEILFQIGNAPGVPRSPHPFAPLAPKSFLCAVLLPSFHSKVALQLACVAMTLVLFNFSKSSKRSSRLHHPEIGRASCRERV